MFGEELDDDRLLRAERGAAERVSLVLNRAEALAEVGRRLDGEIDVRPSGARTADEFVLVEFRGDLRGGLGGIAAQCFRRCEEAEGVLTHRRIGRRVDGDAQRVLGYGKNLRDASQDVFCENVLHGRTPWLAKGSALRAPPLQHLYRIRRAGLAGRDPREHDASFTARRRIG